MTDEVITIREGGAANLPEVMHVMDESFDPCFGEAWTASQCAGLLPLPGVWLSLACGPEGVIGFAMARLVADEAELLLLAVHRKCQRRGVGKMLLRNFEKVAAEAGARRLHLEVREGNHAFNIYDDAGYALVARRKNYYKGQDGHCFDALTLAKGAGLSG